MRKRAESPEAARPTTPRSSSSHQKKLRSCRALTSSCAACTHTASTNHPPCRSAPFSYYERPRCHRAIPERNEQDVRLLPRGTLVPGPRPARATVNHLPILFPCIMVNALSFPRFIFYMVLVYCGFKMINIRGWNSAHDHNRALVLEEMFRFFVLIYLISFAFCSNYFLNVIQKYSNADLKVFWGSGL